MYVHYQLSLEYHKKLKLCIQKISGRCILSRTNQSRRKEVPSFHLQEQGVSDSGASLLSKHSPPRYLLICPHHSGLPSSSGDIDSSISGQLVSSLPSQVLLCHQSQLLTMLRMESFKLNVARSELELVQDIRFLGIRLLGLLADSKAWEIVQ